MKQLTCWPKSKAHSSFKRPHYLSPCVLPLGQLFHLLKYVTTYLGIHNLEWCQELVLWSCNFSPTYSLSGLWLYTYSRLMFTLCRSGRNLMAGVQMMTACMSNVCSVEEQYVVLFPGQLSVAFCTILEVLESWLGNETRRMGKTDSLIIHVDRPCRQKVDDSFWSC